MASVDVKRYWDQLVKRVMNTTTNTRFELSKDEVSLWLGTWKAAANGAQGPLAILPIAYLRLPATCDIAPPPQVILNAFIQIVNSLTAAAANARQASSMPPVINIFEAIFDIIKSRLINSVQQQQISDWDNLLESVNTLESCLFPAVTQFLQKSPIDQMARFATLLLKTSEMNELKRKINEQKKKHAVDTRNCGKKPNKKKLFYILFSLF